MSAVVKVRRDLRRALQFWRQVAESAVCGAEGAAIWTSTVSRNRIRSRTWRLVYSTQQRLTKKRASQPSAYKITHVAGLLLTCCWALIQYTPVC